MRKVLLRTMCIVLVTVLCIGVNAQKTPVSASETSPAVAVTVDKVAGDNPSKSGTGWFPLQFNASGDHFPKNGSTAIASDGQFFYVGNWQHATITRLTKSISQSSGVLTLTNPITITIPELPVLRALTHDGTHFYASGATNKIWKLDMTARVILETITLPEGIQARHCTFDPTADGGNGGFWVGDWLGSPNPDVLYLVNRSGDVIREIPAATHGLTSIFGTAFYSTMEGNYLWTIDAMRYADATIRQIDLATGMQTATSLNLVDSGYIKNDEAGGGMFIARNIIGNKWTLMTLIQNVCVLGWELPNCPEITHLQAEQIDLDMKLTWAPAESAAGYNIYNGNTLLANVTTPEYLVTGLAPGKHVLGVEAIYNNHCTPVRVIDTIEFIAVACPTITNLQAEQSDTEIKLTWAAAPGSPIGYRVYNGNTLLTPTNITTLEYLITTGLTLGNTYTFGVAAVYNNNCTPERVEYTTTLKRANPVKNLEGTCNEDAIVTLTWDAPDLVETQGEWITHSTSGYQGGLGIGTMWDCIWAAIWTPAELDDLGIKSGHKVAKMKFVLPPVSAGTYTLKIYQGTEPTELYSKEVVFDELVEGAWNEFVMETPVDINPTLELWIGIHSNVLGGTPAAYDNGPIVPGKNKLFHQGAWHDAETLFTSLTGNWCLEAFVVDKDGIQLELQHYNIYRENVKVGQVGSGVTTYEIADTTGIHLYCVSAVYNWVYISNIVGAKKVCHSVECGPDLIISMTENTKTEFSIAPNPAKNNITISAENNFRNIEVISFLGQTVLTQSNVGNTTTLDVSKLTSGVYFVRVILDNGTSVVKKFVKQ
ncbi:MAG: T9SS type A sorting domain-containing protein [Bacteroidetes bacterium]|nr:T9SS type A sorting domain-containing protein [Bacteroidota bacterium]MCL2301914.1 T9SS type A sorting domain-containing protein [Lentimicrobiaceae bacterium]